MCYLLSVFLHAHIYCFSLQLHHSKGEASSSRRPLNVDPSTPQRSLNVDPSIFGHGIPEAKSGVKETGKQIICALEHVHRHQAKPCLSQLFDISYMNHISLLRSM